VDDGWVDVGVGVEVEDAQALVAGKRGRFDAAFGAAPGPVVAFGHE
jgi:hypothetical protein